MSEPAAPRPRRNPPWNHDELILAMDLYVRRGWLDDTDLEVVELSHILNQLAESAPTPTYRNANGVSMKLANFAGIDPNHRGVGLRGAGRRDREVWDEFAHDRARLAREAATIRIRVLDSEEDDLPGSSEVADAADVIDDLAGKPSRGQGFRVSPESRHALEAYAMDAADRYYRERGWDVDPVFARESYDLRCTRGSDELHVEVKGTQSDGNRILLTRNEVAHAHDQFPAVALFIVARIQLHRDDEGNIAARGGILIVRDPWELDDAGLSPLAYEYKVP